jgi:Ran GTPase-activating protein (RanGAP) involved in mRNA processing and transport
MKIKLNAAFFLTLCLASSVSWAGAQCSSCGSADAVVSPSIVTWPVKKVESTTHLEKGRVSMAAAEKPFESKDSPAAQAIGKTVAVKDEQDGKAPAMPSPETKARIDAHENKWKFLPPEIWQDVLTGLSLDEHLKFGLVSRESLTLSHLPRVDFFRGQKLIWEFWRLPVEEFIAFWNRLKRRLPKDGKLEAGGIGVELTFRNVSSSAWDKIPEDVFPHIASISFIGMPDRVLKEGSLPNLRHLCAPIDSEHGPELLSVLFGRLGNTITTTLKSVKLISFFSHSHRLNLEDARPILASLNSLSHLDLSGNKIGGAGIYRIMSMLPADTRNALKSVDVSRTGLGAGGLRDVFSVLVLFKCIEELDLSHNDLGRTGLVFFRRNLPLTICNTLRILHLSGNCFKDRGRDDPITEHLGIAFPLLKLESIDLSYNRLGTRVLSTMLYGAVALRNLTLNKTDLADEGIDELARALGACHNLHALNVSDNRDLGLAGLCRLISSVPSLRTLDISHTKLYQDDINTFIPELKALPSLESLRFKGFMFTSEDVFKLLTTLSPTMKNLTFDEIYGCYDERYGFYDKKIIKEVFAQQLARFINLTLKIDGATINTSRLHSFASSSATPTLSATAAAATVSVVDRL